MTHTSLPTPVNITGIGIDIEDIHRFKARPLESYSSFYTKIFTVREIDYCSGKRNPYPHLAVRFAAKEALMKALGKKIANYRSIEVVFEDEKPFVLWNKTRYTLSLSHDKDKAVAVVVR